MTDRPTPPIRIALNSADFALLVSGRVVRRPAANTTVEIMLSDIGFLLMQALLDDAAGGGRLVE